MKEEEVLQTSRYMRRRAKSMLKLFASKKGEARRLWKAGDGKSMAAGKLWREAEDLRPAMWLGMLGMAYELRETCSARTVEGMAHCLRRTHKTREA